MLFQNFLLSLPENTLKQLPGDHDIGQGNLGGHSLRSTHCLYQSPNGLAGVDISITIQTNANGDDFVVTYGTSITDDDGNIIDEQSLTDTSNMKFNDVYMWFTTKISSQDNVSVEKLIAFVQHAHLIVRIAFSLAADLRAEKT